MSLTFMRPEDGFLGLEADEAVSADEAKAVIIPFGLEKTTSYGGGTARGPSAIVEASHQVELFDEDVWSEPFRQYGVVTQAPDFEIAASLPDALEQLEHLVAGQLEAGKFPLVLGGEHSLTAGAIRPFALKHDDLVVLQFDAHADLRDGYEGEHYSHAAAMRRVLDHNHVKLVSVGIRNISAEEVPFLQANRERISIYWAKDKARWDLDEIVSKAAGRPVYITFDLDGFDSSLMPATGTPEPGGMFFQEAIDIIKAVSQSADVVGADVVELAPIQGLHACDFLAAKLCYKILTYALADN